MKGRVRVSRVRVTCFMLYGRNVEGFGDNLTLTLTLTLPLPLTLTLTLALTRS